MWGDRSRNNRFEFFQIRPLENFKRVPLLFESETERLKTEFLLSCFPGISLCNCKSLQPEEALLKKMMADQEINNPSNKESKPLHPLNQIAESPTHKLLLKQWFKEEELILGRIALKETQIDTVRKEITQLYCFFFLFHSLSLLLLFSSASSSRDPNTISGSCHRSWIPSVCSLLCSLVIIWAIRYKTDVESHMEKLLEREKEDSKLLSKCVQELKLKGVEFDLLKEVDALRRAKSLRIEAKAVRKWSARDFVTLFFVVVSCLVLGLTRVVLCS
ncbi:hypothetical protein BVC80_869g31 [Macleaya cordata]|uniref:Transmembrane protein n=1 Tax=Macleaya cordata TaxID=56857 RepID=A0A200Q315_MACCD|nr:hypothetical protein BVC80_869g28 [Macleaya cordata]OVA04859.1 hypothetical protein BVC80_869g31 [Macleaya cordata]